jgi:hypothetical protein
LKKTPSLKEPARSTKNEIEYFQKLEKFFNDSIGTTADKLSNFSKYVPRQDLTNFLFKYEIFKKIQHVHGSIIECGVFLGGGLMTFAHLSSILEPMNHQRKIVGFDTFSGFKSLSQIDKKSKSVFAHRGGMSFDSFEDLKQCIKLYDDNRFLNHIKKVELVKGDISTTIPKYLKANSHTVVSLLYLDVDVYKPTKIALKNFISRMPKGAIIAFDELNSDSWPGETLAVLEECGINNLRIKRFDFEPNKSYAVLE